MVYFNSHLTGPLLLLFFCTFGHLWGAGKASQSTPSWHQPPRMLGKVLDFCFQTLFYLLSTKPSFHVTWLSELPGHVPFASAAAPSASSGETPCTRRSRFRLSRCSRTSRRALGGETGPSASGRPEDVQAPETASQKADLGQAGGQRNVRWTEAGDFMVFGSPAAHPGSGESQRGGPATLGAQLFPFRHPSLFLFHV